MNRLKIAAANWKMNTTLSEGTNLASELLAKEYSTDVEIVLCVPFTHLSTISDMVKDYPSIYVAGQNMSVHEKGAFTGEISAAMLRSVGASHVIIGHSERREYHQESNTLLSKKLKTAIDAGLRPIFCCGEKLEIRKNGQHGEHVVEQLRESLDGLRVEELDNLIIAYEPIWAIGTGETATPQQAQEMHALIRAFLAKRFDGNFAVQTPILYGGSVKPDNASELFAKADVDGGLVGGASLQAGTFADIINSFE